MFDCSRLGEVLSRVQLTLYVSVIVSSHITHQPPPVSVCGTPLDQLERTSTRRLRRNLEPGKSRLDRFLRRLSASCRHREGSSGPPISSPNLNLVYYKSVTAGFSYPTEIMLSTKRTLVTNQVSNADKLGDFGAVERLGTALYCSFRCNSTADFLHSTH